MWYNGFMNIQRFLLTAVLCAAETYFMNEAFFAGSYFFAGVWAFLLYRDLRRAYLVSKATDAIIDLTKNQD